MKRNGLWEWGRLVAGFFWLAFALHVAASRIWHSPGDVKGWAYAAGFAGLGLLHIATGVRRLRVRFSLRSTAISILLAGAFWALWLRWDSAGAALKSPALWLTVAFALLLACSLWRDREHSRALEADEEASGESGQ